MIEIFYQTLILSGIVILLVLYNMKVAAKRFSHVLTEIIKMNEMNEYDPVKFVEHLPPLINKLGIHDYSYYFYYLDTEYQKSAEHTKYSIKKFVYAQDFTVYFEVSPGSLRREKSYLANLLVETVFLILKIDVNLNLRASTKALSEFSKINTFLSHDIKNLAQFINIMEHNLAEDLSDDKRDKLIDYLRTTTPFLKMRSDRILYALAENAKELRPELDKLHPAELARGIASVFDIDIACANNIEITAERKSLLIIFENIIKNFYDKSIAEPHITLSLNIEQTYDNIIITFSDNGSAIANTEKIFEPFYSEKKGGLGIGLYHCRNIANNMGGTLTAENSTVGPKFILQIKSA